MEKTITFIAEDKKRELLLAKENFTDQKTAPSQELQEKKENDNIREKKANR
jgi:hypothetical protein